MKYSREMVELVRQTIDLHVHVGPEIIPRKYTATTLVCSEIGRLRGAVMKNHFYPTTAFAAEIQSDVDFDLYGSVALNLSVGGLNPEVIRAASLITQKAFFVWLPTISAAQFLRQSKWEMAPEWLSGNTIQNRRSDNVNGISLFDSAGELSEDAKTLLETLPHYKSVLATGHISTEESLAAIEYALSKGQKAIIVTHPIYQRVAMPISIQAELAKRGVFLEQCFSMFSMDGVPIGQIAEQIKMLGPDQIVLSSDAGQSASLRPSDALAEFATLLLKAGIPLQWVEKMMVENPKRLLSLAEEQIK